MTVTDPIVIRATRRRLPPDMPFQDIWTVRRKIASMFILTQTPDETATVAERRDLRIWILDPADKESAIQWMNEGGEYMEVSLDPVSGCIDLRLLPPPKPKSESEAHKKS